MYEPEPLWTSPSHACPIDSGFAPTARLTMTTASSNTAAATSPNARAERRRTGSRAGASGTSGTRAGAVGCGVLVNGTGWLRGDGRGLRAPPATGQRLRLG
ncbi:hypothetical protein GCM10009727_65780 [Actinomadura napierensis]|uniref:Uncharacterized protein n=1 Tax=Actinomadura napierensis TaxID=267854 RepID=A0ABP5M3I8_9ACTN